MELLLAALVAVGLLFLRARLRDLERAVDSQRGQIERLEARIVHLRRESDARPLADEPARRTAAASSSHTELGAIAKAAAAPARPAPSATGTAAAAGSAPRPSETASERLVHRYPPPPVRPPVPPPPASPPPPLPPPEPWFDWESLVGVKLFSAIAGIALVLAAVFFLRYSIEHGWLQPIVRVTIGIIVASGLLVACEMKAARRYPVTANALDAAAIAIFFSTFFAAHALWNLIPASVAFALLAIVTALAVLLSIRRESLFIAVLGLLGGFATPALLSTGENRPIPLFAYLMLLNVGLAWVAYRQRWTVLTVLTLVFTTLYQWGWVLKFLTASDLSLAMGIFLVFPIATFTALILGGRMVRGAGSPDEMAVFEGTAIAAAVVPLFFAAYLAAVPAYGARAWLLFGFLLLVDAALFAVALARRQELLHAAGAAATLLVMAVWLAVAYTSAGAYAALVFCAAFATLYACAPAMAARLGHPLENAGLQASFAAPLLLFVPAALARVEPQFSAPLPLFLTLLAVVLLVAWRAVAERRGALYFVAAFFAIATQALWSLQHLTPDRLGIAVAVYVVFGLVAMFVPVVARRAGRPLEPSYGPGLVLMASLGLLLFLTSTESVAPAALWALALLLAIINAGLFVESAAGHLPLISIAGTVFSWIVLATWWWRAAAAVGVLPSLTVLVGLTLVTLGGHAWAKSRSHAENERKGFGEGLYLGLIGHLFLFFVAANREWSLPPWPVFGTMAVITLATSAVALLTRAPSLHAAGTVAAAAIVAFWTGFAGEAWVLVGLAASATVSGYSLCWIWISARSGDRGIAAGTAAGALFGGVATAIVASAVSSDPPFVAILTTHVLNLALVLALTWWRRWEGIALFAVLAAAVTVFQIQFDYDLTAMWRRLLTISGVLYGLFVAYPLVLGERSRGQRDPYLAAVLASVMFFVAGRAAFRAGGFEGIVGIVPVTAALVLAVLLRQLLRIEPAAQRDMGRLALVAGAALAFVTVAIPLQLEHQWITIGWALEGAALAWLYGRVPHRGLLYACVGLLCAVFVRLALNPAVFEYEPRGALRIFNWYLYTYLIAAASLLVAGWWLSKTNDDFGGALPRASAFLPAAGVILLFLLLNIEITDYFATGRADMFRFGVSVSQDLTYTIGWLVFGIGLLAAGIYLKQRPARVTAVTLIALTAIKCFLYDLGSFGGLYRVASLVGLAMSLALVALALQKYVLARHEERV